MKRNERREKRENLVEKDFDLGRFFELATSNKTYVNNINLHGIKNEILQGYNNDFELNGKKRLLDLLNIKRISDLKIWTILKDI